MAKYLYGLTIHGIQSYIFETNNLKAIIGASEIIEEICTSDLKILLGINYKENNLILGAAGNIKYIFDELEHAQKIYTHFPNYIKDKAGDISFSQAIITIEGEELTQSHLNQLEQKLIAHRNKPINIPDTVLMNTKVSRQTGKPCSDERSNIDRTTFLKELHDEANLLINKISNQEWIFPKEISQITNEKNKNYLAIIHADGNNLGINIQKILSSNSIPNKTEHLKNLSKKIEKSTIEAFKKAFNEIIVSRSDYIVKEEKKIVPLRPVILGGDDLTIIIRADIAIEFTMCYLSAFEKFTKSNFETIENNQINGLTATAGITFIKNKYPFHYGVKLCDNICSYAKTKTERKRSSLLFYKVKDSFVNDYNNIVKKEFRPFEFNFENGPYSIEESKKIIKMVNNFKSDSISKGAFRELIKIMYENKDSSEFLWERIKQIQGNQLNKIGIKNETQLKDYNIIYDLITLDSLTTDN